MGKTVLKKKINVKERVKKHKIRGGVGGGRVKRLYERERGLGKWGTYLSWTGSTANRILGKGVGLSNNAEDVPTSTKGSLGCGGGAFKRKKKWEGRKKDR